jgi:hypothetical protein
VSESETSSIADVVDSNSPDLSWHRVGEQSTSTIANGLRTCRAAEIADEQNVFLWRLRVIVHVRALYEKVRLPRSHPDHIPSTEWKKACKQFGDVGSTHAAAIVQRELADPFTLRHIMARVGDMERIADERHRPVEYPRIGMLLSWFPDPRAPPRARKPDKVTAQDAHIAELESQIELLHAEKSDLVRSEQLLVTVILGQIIEMERLRGFKVRDDRRPRAALDMALVGEAFTEELRRSGRLPKPPAEAPDDP